MELLYTMFVFIYGLFFLLLFPIFWVLFKDFGNSAYKVKAFFLVLFTSWLGLLYLWVQKR